MSTTQSLFEEQVKKTPNKTALIYENKALTYQELNTKANQLAHYLKRTYTIEPDTLIALCLERSEVMIIAILAVLKAGGAYVPIDPKYPQERIDYILQDTQSPLVLTDEWYHNVQENLDKEKTINPVTKTNESHLAYVIYTSGTTGKPKGVMIEHKGLLNHFKYLPPVLYDFEQNDKMASFMAYVFDASMHDYALTLLRGGELHLLSKTVRLDVMEMSRYVLEHKINYIHIPPALLATFPKENHTSLQGIIYGGEPCDESTLEYWSKQCKLYNCYGPTEATICTTYKEMKDGKETKNIGKPIPNVHCYVLDANLVQLPGGTVGELYIGGVALARGYLNRSELTADKFIPNPFQTEAEKQASINSRLYKTGDLVQQMPNGDLEYEGRVDFQVKVRGFRIELGEIENALNNFYDASSQITQSVVLAKTRSKKEGTSGSKQYLVAYYVSKLKLDEEKIFAHLRTKLPDYMVPNLLLNIEKLPLTINGKIDRKALPEPDFTQTDDQFIAPRNESERDVCQVWAEVLGLEANHIGIEDDFFRLGGDSIIAIQIVSYLRQKLNLTVSVKDIFSYKTIASLFDHVLNKEKNISTKQSLKTEQGKLTGNVPLLPIQEWFFKKEYIKSNHWNQSFLIGVPELNITQLESSIQNLFSYYDSFRLKYKKNSSGQMIQYYDENMTEIEFKVLDIKTLNIQETEEDFEATLENIYTNWQNDFNIETGPLARTAYIHGFSDGSARVYFALHHLIIDAVSWRLLTRDLKKLYEQNDLGLKGSSYRQWCDAISEYPQSHKSEMDYWNAVVSDFNPTALQSLTKNSVKNYVAHTNLNAQDTQYLLTECHKTYNTQINDILLTALTYTMSTCTNESVNHVAVEGHGREEIDQSVDITQQVGWFTMMYPVRLEQKETLSQTLKNIKDNLRQIPNKGIGYGALFGYHSTTYPLVTFNYLGQFSNNTSNSKQDWSILSDSSGLPIDPSNQLASLIIVEGAVFNGELKFVISSRLSEDKTQQFAQQLNQTLKEIILHTKSTQRTYLTTSDIDHIVSQTYLDKIQDSRQVDGVYPATSLQQGFIYHALHQGNLDDAYRVQLVMEYKKELKTDYFKEAWLYAQKKYPALRLRFAWDEQMVQIIDSETRLNWHFIDLSTEQETETQQTKLDQIIKDDREVKFDIAQSELFRVTLIKQKDEDYTCILTIHHIIADGWSGPRIFHFVHEVYSKLIHQTKISFSVDQSYIEAQKYLQTQKSDLEYWNSLIDQIENRNDLSGLLKSEKRHTRIAEYKHITEPKEHTLTIDGDLYNNLKSFGKKYSVTLNAILMYTWHKILSLYGNSTQTVVGTTISGRHLPIDHIEDSVGLYINTLPLIFDHTKSKSIVKSIQNIQESIQELNQRSTDNLTYLQKDGVRLFDSMFVYDSYPMPAQSDYHDLMKPHLKGTIEKIDYPLGIVAEESHHALHFKLNYASELFDWDILNSLSSTLKRILNQISTDTITRTDQFQYLSSTQYEQMIENIHSVQGAHPNSNEYSSDTTIHSLFEQQAKNSSDKIALVYENTTLTYQELNTKANQLAHYIKRTYSIEPDTLITLCLERSEVMIIAILAVLKAGGAYVPIDPKYPQERIDYILEDTKSPFLLTDAWYREAQKKFIEESDTNPITHTRNIHLVYMIYTSGTTGKPKGVMIEHRGLINHVQTMIDGIYDFTTGDKVATSMAYAFDASIQDFFPTLIGGGQLHVLNEQTRVDVIEIKNYILNNKINHLQLPAALITLLPRQTYESLVSLIYGGAVCEENAAQYWSKNYKLYNCYGPTEASICTTFKKLNPGEDTKIIGKAVDQVQCYVLDSNLTPLPHGAIGELYIGGVGLARGYHNHPTLTTERFIPNPFSENIQKQSLINSRLYKTGDLVRSMPDRNLIYEGRADFQVKIRGFRIELGEIESILNCYEEPLAKITQSVVLAKKHLKTNDQYLAGYYLSHIKLDDEKLLIWLKNKLPEYMVPNILIHLKAFPLTVSGKIDHKVLPEPKFTNSKKQLIAPRNEAEKNVCDIWADVLGLDADQICIKDDFFRLGGNSILAVKLMAKIKSFYNSQINLSHLFLHKTIESQTAKILETRNEYQKIMRLNNAENCTNLFMIQPGTGGCEVYVSLAHKLSHLFNCYGIDSYNLYHEKHIDDLNYLAHYYLNLIDEVVEKTNQTEFHLLGLCLGGKIALEIAGILESRGETKINIYLLDTVLTKGSTDAQATEKEFRAQMLAQGFDESYVEKIVSVVPTEQKFQRYESPFSLKKSKVLLFKTMLPDPVLKSMNEEFCQRILPLKYNNVEKYTENESQIEVVQLHDAYHRNVIQKENVLVEEITKFNKM